MASMEAVSFLLLLGTADRYKNVTFFLRPGSADRYIYEVVNSTYAKVNSAKPWGGEFKLFKFCSSNSNYI